MSIRGWMEKEVLRPRGAWTALALLTKNVPARASSARNMRINPFAYSREGTSVVGAATTGKVTGMFNWISPTDNFLVYQDGTAIKRMKLSDNSLATLSSSLGGARAPSFADLGPRVYFCGWDTSGNGTMQANVHDGASATDACFRGPLAITTFTAADGGGGGLCTLGTHKLAFIFQSRSGFPGQPSPATGGAFAPASVVLSAGLHSITLTLTLTTPADAGGNSEILPIMTRADNLNNWFFLPPTSYTTTNGTNPPASTVGWSTVFTINISDEDLANQTSALPHFSCMVQNGTQPGIPTPPNPSYVAPYGQRMVYGNGVNVYVSDIDNPQFITADLNLVANPSQRNVKIAFAIGQELFLTGDKWTGRVRDNGDAPSTWPEPSTISDAIGAPFPNCVSPKTGGQGNYRWIASEFGLYFFDGSYADKPVTYYVSDQWARINWNYAYTIQMADDVSNLRLYLAVPLDANTEPSHVFVVDYSNGSTYDTCDITFDNYSFATFSSIGAVKEAATSRTALWIGPSAAGNFCHIDPTATTDVGGAAIDAVWISGYVRQAYEQQASMVRLGNCLVWAHGTGTLLHTWYGIDQVAVVQPCLNSPGATPGQIPLANSPGLKYFVKGDLPKVENFMVGFEVNHAGDNFKLIGFTAYTKPDIYNR